MPIGVAASKTLPFCAYATLAYLGEGFYLYKLMRFHETRAALRAAPKTWVVTGAAGFIGSNILEALLRLNQKVVGLDNFVSGHQANLDHVKDAVGSDLWKNVKWITGDIQDPTDCANAVKGADFVLHQAALGSVPRSITDPAETNDSNVSGFINIFWAAREQGIKRFVYASSCSIYGDSTALPQKEEDLGNCLSPYAVSKRINELYANVFGKCYGTESIGLRYFNVFGPRQDPNGVYAAVIPKWISAMLQKEPIHINGDGSTSRDFCYVANVVQANILAATTTNPEAVNQFYNVALGDETTLNQLWQILRDRLTPQFPHLKHLKPNYRPFQPGDVRHSRADISKARRLLGYEPTHKIDQGLAEALDWYVQQHQIGVTK